MSEVQKTSLGHENRTRRKALALLGAVGLASAVAIAFTSNDAPTTAPRPSVPSFREPLLPQEVSIKELLANPDEYHDSNLELHGVVTEVGTGIATRVSHEYSGSTGRWRSGSPQKHVTIEVPAYELADPDNPGGPTITVVDSFSREGDPVVGVGDMLDVTGELDFSLTKTLSGDLETTYFINASVAPHDNTPTPTS